MSKAHLEEHTRFYSNIYNHHYTFKNSDTKYSTTTFILNIQTLNIQIGIFSIQQAFYSFQDFFSCLWLLDKDYTHTIQKFGFFKIF